MKTFSVYRLNDGMFTGETRRARSLDKIHTPAGCGVIEGAFDHLSQRIDPASGKVIDYQPPAPDENHEWNGRRWVKRADVIERERRRAEAFSRISELEARQARPVRELLSDPTNEEAKRRLAEIEAQIAAARAELSETETTGHEARRS